MLEELEQEALAEAVKLLGLNISEKQLQQIGLYFDELLKWNRVYNLTGFKTFEENLVNNLLDCLSVAPFVNGKQLIDVGTGAGLPGMLLAIIKPEQKWTLLDANGKKTRFLLQIKQKLALNDLEIVNSRIENHDAFEHYDAMCSRALDKIPETLNKSHQLLKPKSSFYAMKGRVLDEDLQDLPDWASVEKILKIEVPRLKGERHLIHLLINKA